MHRVNMSLSWARRIQISAKYTVCCSANIVEAVRTSQIAAKLVALAGRTIFYRFACWKQLFLLFVQQNQAGQYANSKVFLLIGRSKLMCIAMCGYGMVSEWCSAHFPGTKDWAGGLLEGVVRGSPKYFCLLKHYFLSNTGWSVNGVGWNEG